MAEKNVKWNEWVLAKFSLVVTLAILLFDLFLKFYNGGMTISRAYGRIALESPWTAIAIIAADCLLILHLVTTLFF